MAFWKSVVCSSPRALYRPHLLSRKFAISRLSSRPPWIRSSICPSLFGGVRARRLSSYALPTKANFRHLPRCDRREMGNKGGVDVCSNVSRPCSTAASAIDSSALCQRLECSVRPAGACGEGANEIPVDLQKNVDLATRLLAEGKFHPEDWGPFLNLVASLSWRSESQSWRSGLQEFVNKMLESWDAMGHSSQIIGLRAAVKLSLELEPLMKFALDTFGHQLNALSLIDLRRLAEAINYSYAAKLEDPAVGSLLEGILVELERRKETLDCRTCVIIMMIISQRWASLEQRLKIDLCTVVDQAIAKDIHSLPNKILSKLAFGFTTLKYACSVCDFKTELFERMETLDSESFTTLFSLVVGVQGEFVPSAFKRLEKELAEEPITLKFRQLNVLTRSLAEFVTKSSKRKSTTDDVLHFGPILAGKLLTCAKLEMISPTRAARLYANLVQLHAGSSELSKRLFNVALDSMYSMTPRELGRFVHTASLEKEFAARSRLVEAVLDGPDVQIKSVSVAADFAYALGEMRVCKENWLQQVVDVMCTKLTARPLRKGPMPFYHRYVLPATARNLAKLSFDGAKPMFVLLQQQVEEADVTDFSSLDWLTLLWACAAQDCIPVKTLGHFLSHCRTVNRFTARRLHQLDLVAQYELQLHGLAPEIRHSVHSFLAEIHPRPLRAADTLIATLLQLCPKSAARVGIRTPEVCDVNIALLVSTEDGTVQSWPQTDLSAFHVNDLRRHGLQPVAVQASASSFTTSGKLLGTEAMQHRALAACGWQVLAINTREFHMVEDRCAWLAEQLKSVGVSV